MTLFHYPETALYLTYLSGIFVSHHPVFRQPELSIVSHITNINFHSEESAWLQATLPVVSGGLGIRSAAHLERSTFLASADGASVLIQQLLPPHLSTITYKERDLALSNWREGLPTDTPQPDMGNSHVQKSWDQSRVQFQLEFLLSNCTDPHSRARLLAASLKESRAWLNAMPVSSLGLRLSNDELHIAVGLRLGAPLCQPHKCNFCSSEVDQLATHGLSCRHSQGRRPRHNAINDIILRSLVASNIPSRLEPSGLHTQIRW